MTSPLVVVNCTLNRSGALARKDAGFINDGRAAPVPVFDASVFDAPALDVALLEAGVCATRAEDKTKIVNSDLIKLDYTGTFELAGLPAGRCANRNPAVITDSHFSGVMFVNAGRPGYALRTEAARSGGRRDRKTASVGPF